MYSRPGVAFFCNVKTNTHFLIFCPVSVFFAQKGPPNEFFCKVFGCVFGPARVQISSTLVLRSVFFLHRQKKVLKSSYRVRGMGPPPGIHFCMCCYHNQQNKKTETKKLEPNCIIVVTAFSLRFHSVRQIVLLW